MKKTLKLFRIELKDRIDYIIAKSENEALKIYNKLQKNKDYEILSITEFDNEVIYPLICEYIDEYI